ncbi:DUF3261 domain-containing protein [Idiomarina ramblicola]|uniref:DUF3261 domain-containing protein n=1 Tax=Idiomarina ramblicola TaxID=263724 RepID=A0A432Z024_9GAMM|nr:DUF3261 domain-containing protein [Idiomarina ramblicola]RUO69536.1 DUF3261 domain-containing protein [Idiomarina ramblicola]
MRLVSLKSACSLLVIALIAGCQSLSGHSVQVSVAGGSYQLQHSWPEKSVQLWQKVEWQKGQQQRTFMVSAVFDNEKLLLVALSPLGHELFRSELNKADGVSFKGSEAFDNSRLALQVWADLQMALWPLDSVNANLNGASLQTTQTKRELWHNDQLLWSSANDDVSQQRVIQNKSMGYQLVITTLEYELLETDDSDTE